MPSAKPDNEDQLALFSPPPRLFSCTPSRITTFEDCPRKYRYTYLDRPGPPKGPPWAHNSLGASVHNALKRWYDLPERERRPEVLPRLLSGAWVTDGYRDSAQVRAVYERALAWLTEYVTSLPEEPVGVERTVAAKTASLALSGRVDRIDERDGELVIVDYKTGRTGLGPDDARGSRALALYAYAAERLFRKPCRTVELHHLPSGQVAAHRHTPESIERHVRRSEETVADIQAETAFEPRPGALCSWCDFRAACPAGQSAAQREPWSAIEGYCAPAG
ncbi:RecB family exonuclease [Longispora albida]|uniref:RecB family exonuclease n=1 Tax=Longispora albida TaxID=203523 RepID=UPI0003A5E363|nr:PD-(D/E)XK nuclease family protein [Longispora albida]